MRLKMIKKIGEVVLFYFNTILISTCLFCCSLLFVVVVAVVAISVVFIWKPFQPVYDG